MCRQRRYRKVVVMNLTGKKVLIIGCGKSGIGAADLLYKAGACPVLFDGNVSLDIEKVKEKLEKGVQAEVVLGEVSAELMKELVLVVVSPGVPVDTPFMDQFRNAGFPIWGEIELAYRFGSGRIIAITGTNGKTTTTTLVGDIMKAYFDSVYVVGNIGNPYTQAAPLMTAETVTVAEISSFQLETVEQFHPAVSAVLNITPDHLDRHHTMENYAAVKASVSANQTAEEFCILNAEDPYTAEIMEKCPAQPVLFSSGRKLEEGYYLDGDVICRKVNGTEEKLMNVHEMNLIGVHNYENVMAAIAISASFGVPMGVILDVVKRFKAVEHRIEYVAEKKGVIYYNDSKGTNPDAAIKAIRAMSRPTVLIGGGYDKNNTYDEWIEAFDGKVKLFVLIGQTKEAIAACARAHGLEQIVLADTFEEAMDICVKNAVPGDAVLLSPACASWGMFPNYEVRGQMFKEYVNRLEE